MLCPVQTQRALAFLKVVTSEKDQLCVVTRRAKELWREEDVGALMFYVAAGF